jgi:hypothetical protein
MSNISSDYLQFNNLPDRDTNELIEICKYDISKQNYKSDLTISENIKLNNYIDDLLLNLPDDETIKSNIIFMKKYLIYNFTNLYYNYYDKDYGFISNIELAFYKIYDELYLNDFNKKILDLYNTIIKIDNKLEKKKQREFNFI